ncbi:Protein-tyrosine phosphatase, receptor/non-receptor type domain and Protein-tyrosine/Dual specificity phosphatase domain and Protein-tyrosine phosphatase, catalytic domain-containing protein [Strongyloides ratti]|uniref:Protein-tyrosine phosphatase, receptor/non-receptor type domain and Protein-tyrosine/Dual specificity phosphatase domain and Protein-tyrosine phosphatase, catalytic domain-containing protein n=1 Tax=Strongyloides ratti TaxID=34506 RepID=A0A090L1D6_STRRB|nr:Protein-tyrosine phosphatase, receptor/non-receptor type domain and Protein-tyrosine/Dual specificity phosphatase domain and Protein-tyrosine phosphatase, catalytic domain-containing protein [Strongyloides ratti]CEF61932.1 Protein-tyrosine phosphatase, receptor/non-receptor type domain and Protein-tyrosine/Dual specificity phosphatase domain and Protein-tyrosine phosphatase, catalytic domain-containing protein [Strongyloides ratti]
MSNNNNDDWLADFNLLNTFIPDFDGEKKSNSLETEQKNVPQKSTEMMERNPFENVPLTDLNCKKKVEKKSDSNISLSSSNNSKLQRKKILSQPSIKAEEASVMAIEDRRDIKTKLRQLDEFSTYILDKEIDGLKNEYKNEIATIIPKPDEIKTFLKFASSRKNRNLTAPCYDHSRVILKEEVTDENYINASYVNTLDGKKRYICAQAPLDNTVVDFWRMIIQENVEVIVMLCEFMEDKKKKCSEYIPLKLRSSLCFDNMAVYLIKREIMAKDKNVVVNHLSVKKGKKELLIKHYTWKNWPKIGCPNVSSTAMYIYAAIYKSNYPILVHCASGIRRSPIFIVISMFMDSVNETKIENEILFKLAKHVRIARAGALTSEIDYIYISRVLLQRFLDRKLIVPSQKMLEFFDEYDPVLKKAQKSEAEKATEMTIGPMPILPTNSKGEILQKSSGSQSKVCEKKK